MTRILLVEDEESYRDPLSYQLIKDGYEVAVAATGPQALELYDRAPVFLELSLATPEPVRQVRLSVERSGSPTPLNALAELSLFP